MKRLSTYAVLVVALLLAGPLLSAQPRSLEVRVVGIADGDTITVSDSNQLQHRIRLAGIDAPEKGQPFSERSKQALSDLTYLRTVTIQWSKTDSYGRFVAKVLIAPPGDCPSPCTARLDVNLAQVDAGLAWHYREYEREQTSPDRKAYAAAEQQARMRRIGIWSQPDPVPPWDQRHGAAGGHVKKSRNDICHAPGMPSYSSVRKFEAFPTLEACVRSGGRLPRGIASPASGPSPEER
jgi:endonuclease YncB( thermonuclease family)